MDRNYTHLGVFSNIVAEAHAHQKLFPLALPGPETQKKVRESLGWCDSPEEPIGVRVERTWERMACAAKRFHGRWDMDRARWHGCLSRQMRKAACPQF